MSRTCALCGASLERHRRHAVYCGAACRAEASRLKRLLRGESADGYQDIDARLKVAQKRTQRHGHRYIQGADR